MTYKSLHFSLSLPKGEGQDNIPELLRHLAKTIEQERDIEIMDIVFHAETDDTGKDWPTFTVYYAGEDNSLKI